jgi:hypothetical protein
VCICTCDDGVPSPRGGLGRIERFNPKPSKHTTAEERNTLTVSASNHLTIHTPYEHNDGNKVLELQVEGCFSLCNEPTCSSLSNNLFGTNVLLIQRATHETRQARPTDLEDMLFEDARKRTPCAHNIQGPREQLTKESEPQ